MIQKLQTLSRQLKKSFPDGLVSIELEINQLDDKEEVIWWLYIKEIGVNKDYKTFEALDHDAHFLLSKQAMGVYEDYICDECDKQANANTPENMIRDMAPWNIFGNLN